MMVSGCTLNLYCDSPKHPEYRINHDMGEFVGSTESACRKKARNDGWKLNMNDQTCICPVCRKDKEVDWHKIPLYNI